jgi:hypothetical protein
MSGCSLHRFPWTFYHCYSNCGVLAEAPARHRTFIIPADHRMLTIHVVFLLSHLIPNPGGYRSYFLHRRNFFFHLFWHHPV